MSAPWAVELFQLRTDSELHLVTWVDHRQLKAAVYGSVALVQPAFSGRATLSKTLMAVRGTSIGITSFDVNLSSRSSSRFISWVFSRSHVHCSALRGVVGGPVVDGCTVVDASEVPREGFLTYCERVYLNPLTGRGPEVERLLPARLHHIWLKGAVGENDAGGTSERAQQ